MAVTLPPRLAALEASHYLVVKILKQNGLDEGLIDKILEAEDGLAIQHRKWKRYAPAIKETLPSLLRELLETELQSKPASTKHN
eukprot:1180086-Prorocentrum_minimum.AAC.4